MTDHVMDTTSITLIRRLQQPADGHAWERFAELYTPLIYHWASKIGLNDSAVSDVVQDVFTTLVEQLPTFEYDQSKSFRAWLCTVTWNKCRDVLRRHEPETGHEMAGELAEAADAVAELSDQEHCQMLARRALELMQTEFEPKTWQACWQSVVLECPASEIAAELGISRNAVYLAKSRVLRRLREEFGDLLE